MAKRDIRSLTLGERKVLFFYAFLGDNRSSAASSAFMGTFGVGYPEFNRNLKSLLKKGFLAERAFNFVIVEDMRLFAVSECLQSEQIARRMRDVFSQSYVRDSVLGFVDAVDWAFFDKPRKPDVVLGFEHVKYILPLIEVKWANRMLRLLDDSDYFNVAVGLLDLYSAKDRIVSPEILDVLCQPTDRPAEMIQDLQDLRALQEYLQWGTLASVSDVSRKRPWQLTLYGIRAAQSGQYAEAAKLLRQALTVLNQMANVKNVYPSPIIAFYHAMVYARQGTEEARKKLEVLSHKAADRLNGLSSHIYETVAQAFLSQSHVPSEYSLSQLIRMGDRSGAYEGINALGMLMKSYFSDTHTTAKLPTPRYDVLRHELRDYIPLTDGERQDLDQKYHDKPILTTIPKKASWEWAMEDILQQVEAQAPVGKTAAAPQVTTRIIYSTDAYGDHVTPYSQTLLKSGRWGRPKSVSKKRFEAKDVEGMDATDINIASHMQHTYYSAYPEFPSMTKVAQYLVGSNRIFLHIGNDMQAKPIEISEGLPKVIVTDRKDFFEIKSNVGLNDLSQRIGAKTVVRIDETHYAVITINERQRTILRRLLALDNVPTSAQGQMRRFLARLEDVVEVQSSLLDSTSVATIEGCDQLVVKVVPDGHTFDLSFYSLPLRGGSAYCRPGIGKTVVYDRTEQSEDDRRVKRVMQAELDNYRDLVDILEGDLGDDGAVNEDDYSATLGLEGMLSLMSHVRQNPEKIIVEWPQGKELRLKTTPMGQSWNVSLRSDNGWFDIEGDVRIDEHTVLTMAQMLQLVSQSKGRFIRLNEQDFIEIDQKLRRQLERLEALAVKNRNKLQISTFNSTLLDQSVLDGPVKIEADQALADMQQRIAASAHYAPEVPAALSAQLRPYQVEGFQWMARLSQWGAGACLADDMGLGKTVQTIAFMLLKASEGPALVVAPASVVPNWMAELARFAPTLKGAILNHAEDREALARDAGPYDVVFTTYGILSTGDDVLASRKWTTIVLDEAHTIKNRETKMSQAVMKLQADNRIILTGTPIQNHLGELWNLFRFINPGLLGSHDTFRQKYVLPITVDNDRSRRKALQRIIRPFMLRRTKTEVMDDLPDKTEVILPVELTPHEMSAYEAMRQTAARELEGIEKVDVNTLAEITRLRRAACAMELVAEGWTEGSSKIQAFVDLVKDFQKEGNRMLVFSQFTSMLQLARKALDQAGEKYLYFDGSTTIKQRERLVEEFRQGTCSIFLISLRAGGLGLNLTEANYVVHLDPWWNPAIEQQATDRAYRIGQQRNVTVYHLISKNTIEEKIRRLHRTKRDLADTLLEGTGAAASLSPADVLALLAPAE